MSYATQSAHRLCWVIADCHDIGQCLAGYATRSTMVDRYGEDELIRLTDLDRVGLVEERRLSLATGAANDYIDACLSGAGYETPLSETNEAITDAACAIARFKLYRYDVPDTVVLDKDAAIAFMDRLAKGLISLPSQRPKPTAIQSAQRTLRFAGRGGESYDQLLD